MARGVVYRTSALVPDESDLAHLDRVGVRHVIDLRTGSEIESKPDVVPSSAEYLNVDILASAMVSGVEQFIGAPDIARARAEMIGIYGSFVSGEAQRLAFGRVFRMIADSDGPAIVHCASGKDRTGWTAAVLQLLAGVSDDDVMTDYLLTNERSAGYIRGITDAVAAEMPESAELIEMFLRVEEAWLEAALEGMTTRYRNVERYLVEGTGLEEQTVERLAARMRGQ